MRSRWLSSSIVALVPLAALVACAPEDHDDNDDGDDFDGCFQLHCVSGVCTPIPCAQGEGEGEGGEGEGPAGEGEGPGGEGEGETTNPGDPILALTTDV